MENTKLGIETLIKAYINNSPENTLGNADNDRAWGEPLVGFSRGDDPLYRAYKEHVGPFHWTPLEAFRLAFPEIEATERDLTVVSWILPLTEKTRADLRKATACTPESCARTRIFGEAVNVKLRQHVAAALQEAGVDAVAPLCLPEYKVEMSERYGYAATWSERHAAHASGLGTFGLCDGLITPIGKAMRCGSVVARIAVEPTPRPYADHREYCLFFTHGACKLCIARCPVSALSESGHDKVKCRAYLFEDTKKYVEKNYGFEGYGCGFCQSSVPCESGIPGCEQGPRSKEGR